MSISRLAMTDTGASIIFQYLMKGSVQMLGLYLCMCRTTKLGERADSTEGWIPRVAASLALSSIIQTILLLPVYIAVGLHEIATMPCLHR